MLIASKPEQDSENNMKSKNNTTSESDAWKVSWSEKDDNWISDGGTTYHKSRKELEEYVESVTSKNTDKYNMIPLFIERIG